MDDPTIFLAISPDADGSWRAYLCCNGLGDIPNFVTLPIGEPGPTIASAVATAGLLTGALSHHLGISELPAAICQDGKDTIMVNDAWALARAYMGDGESSR